MVSIVRSSRIFHVKDTLKLPARPAESLRDQDARQIANPDNPNITNSLLDLNQSLLLDLLA